MSSNDLSGDISAIKTDLGWIKKMLAEFKMEADKKNKKIDAEIHLLQVQCDKLKSDMDKQEGTLKLIATIVTASATYVCGRVLGLLNFR